MLDDVTLSISITILKVLGALFPKFNVPEGILEKFDSGMSMVISYMQQASYIIPMGVLTDMIVVWLAVLHWERIKALFNWVISKVRVF